MFHKKRERRHPPPSPSPKTIMIGLDFDPSKVGKGEGWGNWLFPMSLNRALSRHNINPFQQNTEIASLFLVGLAKKNTDLTPFQTENCFSIKGENLFWWSTYKRRVVCKFSRRICVRIKEPKGSTFVEKSQLWSWEGKGLEIFRCWQLTCL